jgi:hypothetical protein
LQRTVGMHLAAPLLVFGVQRHNAAFCVPSRRPLCGERRG